MELLLFTGAAGELSSLELVWNGDGPQPKNWPSLDKIELVKLGR